MSMWSTASGDWALTSMEADPPPSRVHQLGRLDRTSLISVWLGASHPGIHDTIRAAVTIGISSEKIIDAIITAERLPPVDMGPYLAGEDGDMAVPS